MTEAYLIYIHWSFTVNDRSIYTLVIHRFGKCLAQQHRPETDGAAAARLFVSAVLNDHDMLGHCYNGAAS